MPSLGADMEAGTLVEWVKHPGDAVKRGDIIAVVDTQKMEHTIPLILAWDENLDVGSDTGTPVDDADYQVPFAFTGTIGKITLNRNGTLKGEHYATNSPMWGQVSSGMRLRHSTYTLEGTYQVIEAGPPMRASARIAGPRRMQPGA